ncbi:MAG TPA: hypothetical protein PK289_01680 [Bacteroidia bacterium]|jgi:hypothetical protein|nr:hypothetical protein [Bacteroidia bacterium]
MDSENKDNIIHSTREGRLYIETVDFFKQAKIQQIINELLDSDIIRQINARKKGDRAA